ncbi:anaerobic sulfite reductase subunit AsrB [Chitinispirillales bacterium ANBcel5]|uniref:anaerobic sulfite reductase subunit AsrB n=1 Tax=Cellulosispirillum alkaliphilum TaxID=3039283 RepID=UPI002A52CCEE|nr:anaerobic sulfite reductase subunit AsrB [Chitinispirillales bacterium ANBcel5]
MKNPYLPEPCRIVAIKEETDIESTFTLKSSIRPQHGQFVEVSKPGVGEAPISVSGFGEGFIELTIRKAGHLTGKILESQAGETLFVRGPYGVCFPADLFAGKNLIVASGGCAVAPVRTLIRSRLADQEQVSRTSLLFGFKDPQSILFRDEIDDWKEAVPVVVTIDKEACSWTGKTGFITAHVPDVAIADPATSYAVVVGPPVMMKYTTQEFMKRGLSPENIYVSFERRMACGIGKCGHCKIDDSYVCVDGPVYRYDKALRLLD